MARAEIFSGVCGFHTNVETSMNGSKCRVSIHSECNAIQRLAQALSEVNPFQEISHRRSTPKTLQLGAEYCTHAACPVPVGIIKAVEIEAGLALPADVSIKLSKTNESSTD
ncbi:MAG: hypothetical protein P8074_19535 [Anaerolineales bacterium]|jgi:hypothetical protein